MKLQQFFMILFLSTFTVCAIAQTDFYNNESDKPVKYVSTSYEAPIVISPLLKGNFMIGTGIGFSTSSSKVDISSATTNFNGDGGRSSQFNVSPSIGYFFANNFAFGLGMEYIASRTAAPDDINKPDAAQTETVNTDLLFGPFARIYLPLSDDKSFFIGTTMGFGSSRAEFDSDSGSQTVNNNLLTVGVGPGFTIIATDGLALESSVTYNFARSKSDLEIAEVTRITKSKTHAFDFSVGIRYYFGGLKGVNN